MEQKMQMTATYKGRPVNDLTREELVEALVEAAIEIHRLMEEKERELKFIMENFVVHGN